MCRCLKSSPELAGKKGSGKSDAEVWAHGAAPWALERGGTCWHRSVLAIGIPRVFFPAEWDKVGLRVARLPGVTLGIL